MIKNFYTKTEKIIEEMYNSQMPINRIADRINVARSTLYRELRRGGVTEHPICILLIWHRRIRNRGNGFKQ